METPESTTYETLRRKAYLEAMRLYRKGADAELIYARLDKQGFPEKLILQVLGNLQQEEVKIVKEKSKDGYALGLVLVGVGIVFLFGSIIFFSNIVVVPVGLIIGGIVMVIKSRK